MVDNEERTMTGRAESERRDHTREYPSRCLKCEGAILETITTLVYTEPDGAPRVVHRVPAGVCRACGEKYLRPKVTEAIERLLSSPPAGQEEVPAWDFGATS